MVIPCQYHSHTLRLSIPVADYLSTAEVARYLRLNQKKIYALVAAGQLPAARISGKWLFPRALVDRWIESRTVPPAGGMMLPLLDEMLVLQGSDDWLLSRVVDRFQAHADGAVPSAAVGSLAGLTALARGRAHLAACHVAPDVAAEAAGAPTYLFALFSREQGILYDGARRAVPPGLSPLCRPDVRFAVRQELSGTHRLVARLLAEQGLTPSWTPVGPFSSHLELALAIRGGRADAGVGVQAAAALAGLDFVPLAREEFDLAVPAAFLSHRRVSRFLEFATEDLAAEARRGWPGYGFDALGRLRPLPRRAEGGA